MKANKKVRKQDLRAPVQNEHDIIIQFIQENKELSFAQIAESLAGEKEIVRAPETLRKMWAKYAKDNNLAPKRATRQNSVVLPPEEQFKKDVEDYKAKREETNTSKQYKVAIAEIEKLRKEIDVLSSIGGVKSSFKIAPKSRGETESTAVVVFSDWHVAERVTPESVDYSNEYSMAIAKQRAEAVFRNALKLVKKEQKDTTIDTLIVALIGDFVSSSIHEELLEVCEVPPIEETLFAQELISSGLDYLLANSQLNLVIPCAVGN